jgi:NADPH:quinone reductase-like Zn-dependent oxidoreductase
MSPTNTAAWLPAENKTLEVGPAPYTRPSANEIVIKNFAIALNPIDRMVQAMGSKVMPWIKPPFVLGSDVAGEVVEVGTAVTRFAVGDRVVGNAVGTDKRSNLSSEGAFQQYVILRTNLASPIPDDMSYERACVLPLCLSTAASSLFMKKNLGLRLPTASTRKDKTGETILIWGGSTSLGSNAIQLAVAAGYEVITTASPKNFDYVKRLGASQAFDYHSSSAVSDIIAAMKGKSSAGAIAIGNGSMGACIDILAASSGSKSIAAVSVPQPSKLPPKGLDLVRFLFSLLSFFASTWVKCKIKGVKSNMVWGTDLMENEVGKAIYEDFLPDALREGRYVAAPEPQVVGKGLERIQEGMEAVWQGVSAKKVVVLLE